MVIQSVPVLLINYVNWYLMKTKEREKNRSKILFVWSGLKIGGSERALLTLTQYLSHFYSPKILCHQHICEYPVFPSVEVVYVKSIIFKLPILSKLIDKFFLFTSIYNYGRNVDSIISNEFPLLSIFSFIVARLHKKKFIIWNHSCRSELQLSKNFIVELFYKYVISKTDHIVNVSNYSQESLFSYMGKRLANSCVIYNVVECKVSNIPHKVLDKSSITIVAIGSLIREKNFSLLIKAVAVLKKVYALNLLVNICGDGQEKNSLAKLIDTLDLNEIVFLVGKVNNPLDYIQSSDLLVSTSNSESFSLVVCEALLLYKPVIVTNTGAAEVVENGKYGIVIEKNNVEQLVAAILEVANNSALVHSMVVGYEKTLSRFAPEMIIPMWRLVLAEL
jgi:glycosyltransferase involved in cell wall biosynthesis